jgi:ABC-type transport system involved in cytochrome c biogenesis permease subunit
MVARIVGSMIVSVAALIVVSLLVSLGVLWWTASVITSSAIGTMCALAAAFTLDALPALRRSEQVNGSETKTIFYPTAAGNEGRE